MRVRGLRATLAAAAVVALTLSGCGDDAPQAGSVDDESTPASKTTTEEPTDDPTTEEPTDPETTESEPTEKPTGGVDVEKGDIDDEELAAEAESFAQEFMNAYDEAAGSGDFSTVSEMHADSCGLCKRYISSFRSIYEDGGRVEGGGFTDPQFSIAGSTADSVFVRVQSTIAPYKVIDASGDTVDENPEQPSTDIFQVRQDADGGWQVVGWSEGS